VRARWTIVAALALAAACSDNSQQPTSTGPTIAESRTDLATGPRTHVFYAKGQASRKPGSADMIWHNGPIMKTAMAQNIFWGPSWGNSSFVGDKITGLDDFMAGYGGSNYAATSSEYSGTNGQVGNTVTTAAHVIDLSTASGGGNTSAILAEVCKVIKSPVSNGFYAVYTDLPRGNASYCAWHSYGSCNGTPVQFAFFWKLDGDAACDPQDALTNHSQGLAALANVAAHELSEARTDPDVQGGWYDRQGAENGDKCAWTFNVPYVTFSNGTNWKVQGEWSNKAYDTGVGGYPNRSGQKGCLDGH
jgi:hypothetical protein